MQEDMGLNLSVARTQTQRWQQHNHVLWHLAEGLIVSENFFVPRKQANPSLWSSLLGHASGQKQVKHHQIDRLHVGSVSQFWLALLAYNIPRRLVA